MKAILRSLLPALFLLGCSTDLDIIAPYKNITVVYAVLSTNETTHFVKINKAFLGDGDAFVYALEPDSSEYTNDQLQARVEELDNGNVVNSWTLNDTLLTDRIPGTFYSPDQKLYTFNATLDPDRDYRVICEVNGELITASTPIVNNFTVNAADANPNGQIGLRTSNGYTNWELNWNSGRDGRRYEVYYRFNYREVRGTDTTDKSITRLMGVRVTNDLDGNESMNASLLGENFYQGIGTLVQPDPTVDKRIYIGIDMYWYVASDEFHTYLTLQNPLTGIVEERPDYTNVANGYGLVGSRYFKILENKKLNAESVLELVSGQYTGTLGFCSPYTTTPGLGCN